MSGDDVDARINWLAGMISMPRWQAALRAASEQTTKFAGYDASAALNDAGSIPIAERSRIVAQFAVQFRELDPVLALAFELLALRTTDAPAVIHAAVAGATGLLCSADGDTAAARARLRVWDDVGRGKYAGAAYGADFLEIAERHWSGEMQQVVAKNSGHPALDALMERRWDDALAVLYAATVTAHGIQTLQSIGNAGGDRDAVQSAIAHLVEHLYAIGTPTSGARALAWQMLTADPRRPASFVKFLPQLQFALDGADDIDEQLAAAQRDRIRIWWQAAEGEWTDSDVSIFRIADVETERDPDVDDLDLQPSPPPRWTSKGVIASVDQALAPEISGPTLVVMPSNKATKLNNYHTAYRDVVGAPMPLVVARDVAGIRDALHAEFPHAVTAVDLLLRDLREGKPAVLKPVILVGSPGAGKSRLVRRLAEGLGIYVFRFDAASATDGHFGGTSKTWGNTEASVPMRAVAQSRSANPVVMIDEIDKATAAGGHNGSLFSSLSAFTDRETSARYRDQSLDAEVNLSALTFIATANDISKLPSHIRDRFRVIRVPDPTLQHLPALAANVMAEMAAQDEARSGDASLAADELAVIAMAWAKAGFSMRKLQMIVGATLEARDQYAMRH